MINIIAIILSPIIAIWIGGLLQRRSFRKERRLEVVYRLMAYRDKIEGEEFLSALNSLLLFYKDSSLHSFVFELRNCFLANNIIASNVLITKIIKRVCELEKFRHLTFEDINNLFRKK